MTKSRILGVNCPEGCKIKVNVPEIQKEIEHDDRAVSPIMGILLMLVIVTLIAGAFAVYMLSITDDMHRFPSVAITVQSNPDTSAPDLKIVHRSGERLENGDWHLSVVPVGSPPVYRRSSSDFAVGEQIFVTSTTNGAGNYIVNKTGIYTDPPSPVVAGRYDVKILLYPFKSLIVDTVVEVK